MKKFINLKKTYFISAIVFSSALTPLAHAQMIPGYNKSSGPSLSAPPPAKIETPSASAAPTLQSPALPERAGGYVKNPMPSSVAPRMVTPPPSNRVMDVNSDHIVNQVGDIVKTSDERINKISLGDEKFPEHKANMTELERDLDFDHRLREMSYLQKLSENGMKLFNTTYDGKREWVYDQNANAVTAAPSGGGFSGGGSSEKGGSAGASKDGKKGPSFDSEADRLQVEHERALLEKERLEDEKKQMEKAKQEAEHKAERHKKDLEIAKQRMKEATPDPKVTMIYGNGVVKADILVPYYGRVIGLKKGEVIAGDRPMTIVSIGDNTVTAKDEKGGIHVLTQGDSVPKVRPSISKFMPEDEE